MKAWWPCRESPPLRQGHGIGSGATLAVERGPHDALYGDALLVRQLELASDLSLREADQECIQGASGREHLLDDAWERGLCANHLGDRAGLAGRTPGMRDETRVRVGGTACAAPWRLHHAVKSSHRVRMRTITGDVWRRRGPVVLGLVPIGDLPWQVD